MPRFVAPNSLTLQVQRRMQQIRDTVSASTRQAASRYFVDEDNPQAPCLLDREGKLVGHPVHGRKAIEGKQLGICFFIS